MKLILPLSKHFYRIKIKLREKEIKIRFGRKREKMIRWVLWNEIDPSHIQTSL